MDEMRYRVPLAAEVLAETPEAAHAVVWAALERSNLLPADRPVMLALGPVEYVEEWRDHAPPEPPAEETT